MKKLTTEEFIEKARTVHGDRYDYSNANYTGTDKLINIICLNHGEFSITPHSFLIGHGCPSCSNRERNDTKNFVKKAMKIHMGRYDYSKVDCKGSHSIVSIICPIHGEFLQKASLHLSGHGCQKCFATPKSSTEEFVEKGKGVYGDKYDYSKVDYKGNKIKVIITCPKHGDWCVTPNNFLRGSECPKCFGTPKHTQEEFIKKVREIHGYKYDYSCVHYNGLKERVKIICPIHGEFVQFAGAHLRGGGCSICSIGYKVFKKEGAITKIDKETFLERCVKNHKINYDYSLVDFQNSEEKICIICPTHGKFWQGAKYHMKGGNCPKCVGGKRLSREYFIEKAKNIHGDKYDYSKVVYKNYSTKVCIVCSTHGEFLQTPNTHLFGAGCPTCVESYMEGELREILKKNGIKYEQEKGFSWLRFKKKMFLDFYLPDYNIAIECQGGQHFFPVDLFGGEEFFNKTMERDKLKHELCEQHGIRILYFSKSGTNYIYPVFQTYSELLEAIKR